MSPGGILPVVEDVDIGQNATFACISHGKTRWYFVRYGDGYTPRANPISQYEIINIDPVSLYHSGYYYCYGAYSGKMKHFLARAELKVYGEYI